MEYSSPSGIGPSAAGGAEAAPLNALPSPLPLALDEADADTGGEEDASWGVSFEHMVPEAFEAPEHTHKNSKIRRRKHSTASPKIDNICRVVPMLCRVFIGSKLE